ncbi:hypothetical protein SERLADRAFT_352231 [Serpula lacrymans var. lacrymans S7.9]|uniref:Peptidase A2 domain-containing protein n=1 Tax=Serpula lacrymans var. lacrymans (strain S7.9) TaxID=578457 RepID=F8P9J6_SERL9|nr:uncharacterized protein SERLADRAFT_352231 [Serpula lacrymans var. lacrymans S7.9]EGO20325.1 hypothetical protein SERLADRAFT_352231 [Serpula lacrymans var. lacrymans S7.9]
MIDALLDSGCTGSCIDSRFVEEQGYERQRIPRPIPVYNADGTFNRDESIKEFIKLLVEINDHDERLQLAVVMHQS